MERTALDRRLTAELQQRFGKRFSTGDKARNAYCHRVTLLKAQPPDAVLTLTTTEEVVMAAALCRTYDVPIVPFGAGTSLEGQVNAPRGGIAFDFGTMNKILNIDPQNLTATVQPGVTREDLNRALEPHGLFFPVDPGANATLGGMTSTRASGTNAVKYGTMRTNTMALKVITADGTVTRIGTAASKSAMGYNLVQLFVGAEGTLGLIVELTLRLVPLPASIGSGRSAFPDLETATRAVVETTRAGVDFARIELLDEPAIQAVNRYSG
ncbi:MAG: FAD-binding protein, partial [Verrucomicrobiota bacterium]